MRVTLPGTLCSEYAGLPALHTFAFIVLRWGDETSVILHPRELVSDYWGRVETNRRWIPCKTY